MYHACVTAARVRQPHPPSNRPATAGALYLKPMASGELLALRLTTVAALALALWSHLRHCRDQKRRLGVAFLEFLRSLPRGQLSLRLRQNRAERDLTLFREQAM